MRHELLITKVTFINKGEASSREELYDIIGNNPEGALLFKTHKTLWLDGSEYKIMNVSFKVEEHNGFDGTNCEVVIEIEHI